jgi:hypothetical protein
MQREAVSMSGKQQTAVQQQDGGTSMSTGTDSKVDMLVHLPCTMGGGILTVLRFHYH